MASTLVAAVAMFRSALLAVAAAYVTYLLVRVDGDFMLAHARRKPEFWNGKVVLVTGACQSSERQ